MTALASENDVSEAKPAPARGRLFRKYLASLLAVVCVALIANGALDAWFSYQEQKRLLIAVQRVEADAAATKIGEFINQIEDQIGWLSLFPPEAVMPGDPRLDAIRLLRLEPAIAEIARLDPQGREEMRVSRNTRDVVGSGADLSATPAFLGIKAKGFYHGPVYFFRETEPYMTIGVKGPGRDPSVYIAEVNLRFIWDLVSRLKVGATGNAYVVDARGRLVAHPELWRVLRNTDLSRLAQVHAALTGDTSQDAEVAEDLSGHSVLSAHALVPSLGWHVFVELPIEEGYASIRASIERSALLFIGLLGCAVAAAFLLSRHMTVPIQALARGAERIGVGHLDQRIKIKTGDELEVLGDQFNRMAARLQDSYATLERRVDTRTAELASARDLAMAEHAEAVRARQMAELANEAKSRFLAVISHEIRTPMNGILGVLQLLDRERADAEERRLLEIASASSATLTALIDAILDYARLEAGTETIERSDFDLRRLVEAAAGLMRPQAQAKGLAFELAIEIGKRAFVNGDPVRINRILLNLLANAIKFTEKGKVGFAASLERPREGGALLGVTVSDNGIGIAPEMRERIFAEFTQGDDSIARRFGGSGLGLAISRQLAELMGGSLNVESAPGVGSSFRLELPLALAAPAIAKRAIIEPVEAPSGGLASFQPFCILIVDDDAFNRDVTATMLRRLGHRPELAEDGRTAIEMVEARAFDVVLMDLGMPGMDGFEAASRMQSLPGERKPRIIALTADMSEASRARLAEIGISAIVGKPILIDALRRALAGEAEGSSAPSPVPDAKGLADDGKSLLDFAFLSTQEEVLGRERLRRLRGVLRRDRFGFAYEDEALGRIAGPWRPAPPGASARQRRGRPRACAPAPRLQPPRVRRPLNLGPCSFRPR